MNHRDYESFGRALVAALFLLAPASGCVVDGGDDAPAGAGGGDDLRPSRGALSRILCCCKHDAAIKSRTMPANGGKFIGDTASGLKIEGWLRNGVVDTFYPKF